MYGIKKCSICGKEINSGAWFYILNPYDYKENWEVCLPVCPECMLKKGLIKDKLE